MLKDVGESLGAIKTFIELVKCLKKPVKALIKRVIAAIKKKSAADDEKKIYQLSIHYKKEAFFAISY
jgi:hypothetical protein